METYRVNTRVKLKFQPRLNASIYCPMIGTTYECEGTIIERFADDQRHCDVKWDNGASNIWILSKLKTINESYNSIW